MPFDAIGFPAEVKAQPVVTSPETTRFLPALWRAFRRRIHDVYGRSEVNVTVAMIEDARALIAEESQWIQGHYLRNGRRCAMGALQEAGRHYRRSVRRDASAELLKMAWIRGHHSVESMNDNATHGEVLKAFDAAVAGVRARRG
jgi:hypothetical protein